ncbi:hypothetical protein CkaCkLH20_02923 [Colletotrichum karsti]|uniref:Myb-like domain-containing protein n=1 Tax=Colletotrichum karsti TaxID=1095194 RepID=A0A9P6IB78_9PEZI|nr:uncharacterized protein CkaCkLH20_02923 [Colletotrichum karsti]KAF9879380.1 hypothetical protein CkaCkLH20_02923 [Colletotrichum karsti]
MVQTRAKTGAADQPADSGRAARSTRQRGTTENNTGNALPAGARSKRKGKQLAAPTGISDDEEDDEEDGADDDGEDEVKVDTKDAIGARNLEIPRRGAREPVRSISPPPSDIGSQMGTQKATTRFTNPYTRDSSVQASSQPRGPQDQQRSSFGEQYDEEPRTQRGKLDVHPEELAAIREDALEPLWSTTQGLARFLFKPDIENRFQNPLLRIQRDNWANIVDTIFTNHANELFIDLSGVSDSLSDDIQVRGRAVIAASNAACLQNELVKIRLQIADFSFIVEHLNADFPKPFFNYVPGHYHEAITDEMISLAIEIRTQTVISRLRDSDPSEQDPAGVAANLFCNVDPSVDGEEALKHGPYHSICDNVESPLAAQRARDIVELIEGKDAAHAVAALADAYPFGQLSSNLTKWAHDIIERTEDLIREAPPDSSMRRSPSPTDSISSSEPQEFVRKNVHENLNDRNVVKHLMQLSRQRRTSSPPPPQQPPVEDEAVLRGIVSRSTSRAAPEPSTAARNTATPGPSGFTPVNGTKRPPQSQDTDDAFEEDTRSPDPERRAQLDRDRRDMPPPAHRPRKRQRVPSQPEPQPSSSRPPTASSNPTNSSQLASSPPPSSSSRPPASSDPANASSQPPPSTGLNFTQIRQQNRLPPSRGPGAPQRQPWSDMDTSRLIKLVDLHHCKWAVIARRQDPPQHLEEEMDLVLDVKRDQQAIRDKARNVKVDLLKADLNLFRGFDDIFLGKKERLALIARGKNPDRKEADVDEHDIPTNTDYFATD